MIKKEDLPITKFVSIQCEKSTIYSLNRFREHVAPLKINARGNILIVGPGEMMEELAIIEPEVSEGIVTSITTIGSSPVILEETMRLARSYNVKFEHAVGFLAQLFTTNNEISYDTILFIGNSGFYPNDLKELTRHLNPKGRIYLTINGEPPEEMPVIDGCHIQIIRDIPTNPNYNIYSNYFGIVVTKER